METPPLSFLGGNPLLKHVTAAQLSRIERGEWYHSIELPNGEVIPGIIPVPQLRNRLTRLGVPENLTGMRALDIGAATGWNSFELERRGAEVVAIDCVEYEDFRVAHALLNSKVEYLIMELEEVTADRLGKFDCVLFLGVLYHLRHPLLGLERVLSIAADRVFVESFVCDARLTEIERASNRCYMEFYETTELAGQLDNWVGPSTNCLLALCRSAGFVGVELRYVEDNRAGVFCRRKFESTLARPELATPVISSAVNNRTGAPVFHRGKDEYVCVYFRAAIASLSVSETQLEVDGYGVPVLTMNAHDKGVWQANLRLPADMGPGVKTLRLRLNEGGFSNSVNVYVDCLPPPIESSFTTDVPPRLYRVTNGLSESTEFHGSRSEYMCCCFYLDAAVLRTEDVLVRVGNRELTPTFVGCVDGWQANVKLPKDMAPGTYPVQVAIGRFMESNPLNITVQESGSV